MDDDQGFGIVITAQMRHGELWAAAKRLGSVKALAEQLEMQQTTVGSWVNLRSYPKFGGGPERAERLRIRLVEALGKSFDELWPSQLCEAIDNGKLTSRIEVARRIGLNQIGSRAEVRGLLPSAAAIVEAKEAVAVINKALRLLHPRLRRVLTLRYGLDGERPMSFAEVGKTLCLSKERVRQLEIRGHKKLRTVLERIANPSELQAAFDHLQAGE